MALIIHATIKVSGNTEQLQPFRERVNALLGEEGDVAYEERHTAEALLYDFKVQGGIPFPPFVQASSDFPGLVVSADWINPDAGVRGAATIKGGRLAEHRTESLAVRESGAPADYVYVAAGSKGELLLALTFSQPSPNECLGYAVTGKQDAMFRIVREKGSPRAEATITAGSEAAWKHRWLVKFDEQNAEFSEFDPPQAIGNELYRALEKIAAGFIVSWIWFSESPREEIIVETERYARMGYEINEANLRSEKFRQMTKRIAGGSEIFEFSTLNDDVSWVKDIIEQCWAAP